jgi:hypothetical protein
VNLNDRLFQLEVDLDKITGHGLDAMRARRAVLRTALEEYGQQRYDAGMHTGKRDMLDAAAAAERWQRDHGPKASIETGPMP